MLGSKSRTEKDRPGVMPPKAHMQDDTNRRPTNTSFRNVIKKKSPKRKYVTFVHSRRSSALHTILERTAMRYELQLRSIDGGGEHARRTSPANRKCIKTIRKSSIQHPNAVHLNIVYSIRMLFERRAAEAMCDRMSPWRERGRHGVREQRNRFCVIFITSARIQWPKKRQNEVESNFVRVHRFASQIVRVK